jgi:hypothetical protein
MDRYSSDIFFTLNSFRGINQVNLTPKMVWEPLFLDMNTDNSISIGITRDGKSETVTFSKDSSFSLAPILGTPRPRIDQELGMPSINSYPLKRSFKDATQKEYISHFIITNNGIVLSSPIPPDTMKFIFIHHISSKALIDPQRTAEWFGNVDYAGGKAKCIEILNLMDNRIRDLSVIPVGGIAGIYADLGKSSKLPVNVLGDGMTKLMYIVLVMLATPGGIILIDEIENGFHYSFFPKLWEIIGKLSTETKCQVFATTHSYECINGAAALINNDNNSELFRFIRIDRNNGKITPHVFENDSLEYAVKNNWEVR